MENKLYRLRAGMTRLPVMDPFARTLAPREVAEIAQYLSRLPETEATQTDLPPNERGESRFSLRAALCVLPWGERRGERWTVRI